MFISSPQPCQMKMVNHLSPIRESTTRREQAPASNSFQRIKPTENTTDPNQETNDLCVNKVKYDSSDHWSVLTQMYGSVWPKVIGYCIFNVFNAIIVIYIREKYKLDLSFSDKGHTFMSMMMSFLMVTRSNIAYSRYMEARYDLSNATLACRELISYATTFTRYDNSPGAAKWRIDLARRTIKLLRTMVTVLEFQSKGNHAWKLPYLSREEKAALKEAVKDSNERLPMVLTMFIQSTIASHVDYLDPKKPLHPTKELKLYSLVSDFVQAYHGLMKLVTTPFPFPLVQMTRTFLFIWVFTLPWVLVNDLQKIPALVFSIFFITYAFVGLEFVAIELDDPFGDDDNDFDVLRLATITFKDISIYIYDLHGDECNEYKKLCSFIEEANKKTEQLDNHCSRDCANSSFVGGKSGKTHKRRWDSIYSWELSATLPTLEAGSETSFYLQNGRQKYDDLEESAVEGVTQAINMWSAPSLSQQINTYYYGTMDSKSKQ